MAEYKKSDVGTNSRLTFVLLMILVACVMLNVRWVYRSEHPSSSPAERSTTMVLIGSVFGSHGSMNIFEEKLFLALAFLQSHVVAKSAGSWGWAIILLTLGINLLLLPLRISSMRSGLKMQRLQPAIKLIRSRYENVPLTDPRHTEMSAEIAQLQKDSGVNIWGGCLPLLLQMPLLCAFFGMLRKASALHGASWLWLHDLSVADPHHVLPVLMGVSQLLVQWSTPSPGSDPKQQRVVACFTTLMFGYVSWHYASGLALYALTGSLLSLATQGIIHHSVVGTEMRTLSS